MIDQATRDDLLIRFPDVPKKVIDLASSVTAPAEPGASHPSRDETAWELAWRCQRMKVPEEVALELMGALHSLMFQPDRDPFDLEAGLAKVYRVYDPTNGSRRRRTAVFAGSAFMAGPMPAPDLYFEQGDHQRLTRGWGDGIPVIPVPLGVKGSSSLPKWKHLQSAPPTTADWKKWQRKEWSDGNTAILFGFEGEDHQRLYDIEIEDWAEFWSHPSRDYFLAHTPVIRSAKSAHIYITSDEIVPSTKALGRFEFRGAGNYSLAPGSLHPSGVTYAQLNTATDTILKVTNVIGFVKHYFPELFSSTPTADDAEKHLSNRKKRNNEFYAIFDFQGEEATSVVDTNAEFLVTPKGTYKQFGILVESPSLALGKADLVANLEVYLGPEHSVVERVRACGHDIQGWCIEHGDRGKPSKKMCTTQFHTCPTQTQRKIRDDLELGDRLGEEAYRTVRFERRFDLPGDGVEDWREAILNEIKDFQHQVTKASHKARWKGRILARSQAFYLERPVAYYHGTVVVQEDYPGEADELVEYMEKGRLELVVWGDIRIHSGETMVLQLMEMANRSLIGMKDPSDAPLFIAYYEATKGRHLFQGMSALYHVLKFLKREKPVCDVCERPLRFRDVTEEELRRAEQRHEAHAPPEPAPATTPMWA